MASSTTEAYFFTLGEQHAKAREASAYNYEERLRQIEESVENLLPRYERRVQYSLNDSSQQVIRGFAALEQNKEHPSELEHNHESHTTTHAVAQKQIQLMEQAVLGVVKTVKADLHAGVKEIHSDFLQTSVQIMSQLRTLDQKVSSLTLDAKRDCNVKEQLVETNDILEPPCSSHVPGRSEVRFHSEGDNSREQAVTVNPTPAPTTPAPVASLPPKEEKAKQQIKTELQTTEEEFEELEREENEFREEDIEVNETPLVLQESGSLASVFASDIDPRAPPYNVEDFLWKTGINQRIARSNDFANFTVAVVIFNAVYIGVDSDYNTSQNIYEADYAFQICSQFFCVYFTGELVVRFLAFEKKRNCLRDGWFKFDAFLVSTMILDTWILMPTLFVVGGGVKIPTQPLRMLRLFKLTRMARLMKAFPELVTMIKGLMRSLRAISSTMILVVLMVYVWAIMMHMLMKEETDFNNFIWTNYSLSFETMTSCIWTLLMAGTLMLDNASPLMSHLIFSPYFNYILAGFLFCCYTLMSAMCILQMLIGVLCDVVSTVKAEENNASAIGLLKQELLADLVECDDGDGKISEQELATVMEAPRSKALLKKLKVNFPFLRELQKGMYHKPGMQVPIKEVLELMVLCRGENVSTVESMAGALVTIINELSHVKIILERDINKLEHHLTADIEDLKESTEKQAASAAILENRLHEDIAHLEALESGKTEGLHDDITQMGKQLHDDIFHLEVKDAGKGCST